MCVPQTFHISDFLTVFVVKLFRETIRQKLALKNAPEWGGGELDGMVKWPPPSQKRKLGGELFL